MRFCPRCASRASKINQNVYSYSYRKLRTLLYDTRTSIHRSSALSENEYWTCFSWRAPKPVLFFVETTTLKDETHALWNRYIYSTSSGVIKQSFSRTSRPCQYSQKRATGHPAAVTWPHSRSSAININIVSYRIVSYEYWCTTTATAAVPGMICCVVFALQCMF